MIFNPKPARLLIGKQLDSGKARLTHTQDDGGRGPRRRLAPVALDLQGYVEQRHRRGLRLGETLPSGK